MKEITVKAYEAVDGSIHYSEKECNELDKLLSVASTLYVVQVSNAYSVSKKRILLIGDFDSVKEDLLIKYVCESLYGCSVGLESGANYINHLYLKWNIDLSEKYSIGNHLKTEREQFLKPSHVLVDVVVYIGKGGKINIVKVCEGREVVDYALYREKILGYCKEMLEFCDEEVV